MLPDSCLRFSNVLPSAAILMISFMFFFTVLTVSVSPSELFPFKRLSALVVTTPVNKATCSS